MSSLSGTHVHEYKMYVGVKALYMNVVNHNYISLLNLNSFDFSENVTNCNPMQNRAEWGEYLFAVFTLLNCIFQTFNYINLYPTSDTMLCS